MTMMTMHVYPAALERIYKWEAHVRPEAPDKFFVAPLHFFGFTSTISRFGKLFRVASTV